MTKQLDAKELYETEWGVFGKITLPRNFSLIDYFPSTPNHVVMVRREINPNADPTAIYIIGQNHMAYRIRFKLGECHLRSQKLDTVN